MRILRERKQGHAELLRVGGYATFVRTSLT
jgi:hypothetical protein